MKEHIYKGKFLFHYIHFILIAIFLFILLFTIFLYSPSPGVLLLSLCFGILAYILLCLSFPKHLRFTSRGIYIKKVGRAEESLVLWKDISGIEEKTFYRRDSFFKILFSIVFYSIFFLLFKEKHRCLRITDNQLANYHIYDYSYEDYDSIYNIVNGKVEGSADDLLEE